ncbi:MAG: dTDP-4-dehydrorhamnose 3,5-epimerase [Acidobacteriota bacterium]|jgi:dTDP-4-dehydrorhamnose 3,5-epimerase|nr:dTDP-4-dehydrorhamnose 3,5-epimerase [Acidobacteriota bacterium]
MNVIQTALPGVLILEPKVFGDTRGFFLESYNARVFGEATGLDPVFVQDNHSRSARGVLRGLHYQIRQTQGKLVRVTHGRVFDVAVDVRRNSPHFGRWAGVELSDDMPYRMFWIPPGFAHAFLVLSESADFAYKATDYYAPEYERCIRWNDPDIGIEWPLEEVGDPLLSEKDRVGLPLKDAEVCS